MSPSHNPKGPLTSLPPCLGSGHSDASRVLDLDCVPYGHHENMIRKLQATLSSGESFTLEFTTLCPAVHFLDMRFVLCAVPFLDRKDVRFKTDAFQRTTAPLFMSLPRVIELVTSGSSSLVIGAVNNVSLTYAKFLDSIVHDLEVDHQTMKSFVAQWGVSCWREHRLLSAWESGLLKTGLLMRWVVVVHR
jgi:hypothetical protein